MAIEWSERFAVGVAEIDAQHKGLVGQIDRLLEAVDRDPAAVGRVLDFLADYAVNHFATEEELMERHGYPSAEVHRAAHAGFVRTFSRLRYDYELDGLSEGMRELVSGWLVDWLTGHILEMDRELGSWLVAHPEASARAADEAQGTWVVPSDGALRVLSLTPGARLERAGLSPGDLILALGGRRVADLGVEQSVLALASPGPGGLTVTVHPGGDRDRVETRFLPRGPATGA